MDIGGGVRSEFKKMKYEESEEQRPKLCNFRSGFQAKGESTKNLLSTLDLTTKLDHLPYNDAPSCIEDTSKPSQEIASTKSCRKRKSFGLDLNAEDVSSSFNKEPFHPYKIHENVESRDTLSECGSTCGSMVEKDSMRIWKQMKQNGFLSTSHGSVLAPPMPKPRGRKQGNELVIKKKIEIAKREQVNKFAKVAAPSGLLNELNPGIINHVRNRKQVHSIIENLVRSARTKNKNSERKQDDGTQNLLYPYKRCEDDVLRLKLSSTSTMASENMSMLSNDESETISTVDSLSVEAANVASQWLELLHQDIKGRLAALRHSKKRVQSVTQTELPSLISSYLSSNQENESSVVQLTNKANIKMHKLRWTALFDQMDKSLSEEEKSLENSLNQVREMLMRCEHGLFQFPPANGSQQPGTLQTNYIYPKVEPALDKDLAVRAAAAAIYSTSNFLQSAENLPCF